MIDIRNFMLCLGLRAEVFFVFPQAGAMHCVIKSSNTAKWLDSLLCAMSKLNIRSYVAF